MCNFDGYSNKQIAEIIDEWVHGERDREIMKRRIIDKIKLEPLAEEFDLSRNHVQCIVAKNRCIILEHL